VRKKKKESKMEERKFKVGDKVRVITSENPCPKGTIGKVLRVDYSGAMVEFEEFSPRMHNGDGLGEPGHCWYLLRRELELVKPEKTSFKIGDRVVGIGNHDNRNIDGLVGTIITDRQVYGYCGVEFDKFMDGHECLGKGKNGHCWNVDTNKLKPLSNDWKIVIIPEGDKTLGRLYENGKVVKSVSTTKHPDDEYSVETATRVIMERLFPKKEEVAPPEPPFKVGDVIELTDKYLDIPKGTRGVIVEVRDYNYSVDFKVPYSHTHTCGCLKTKTGLFLTSTDMKKVN
jgi:hypothetical protein